MVDAVWAGGVQRKWNQACRQVPPRLSLTVAHWLLQKMSELPGAGTLIMRREPAGLSGLMVAGPLGDCSGRPSPRKAKLLPGIIIAWIITQFRACWGIPGWCQSPESGFCSLLPRVEIEEECNHFPPKEPTWQGRAWQMQSPEKQEAGACSSWAPSL